MKAYCIKGHYKRYKSKGEPHRNWFRLNRSVDCMIGGDTINGVIRDMESIYYIVYVENGANTVYYNKEQFDKYFITDIRDIRKAKLNKLSKNNNQL